MENGKIIENLLNDFQNQNGKNEFKNLKRECRREK